MDQSEVVVTDKNGLQGRIASPPASHSPEERVSVTLENGQRIWVPAGALQLREQGNYYLPMDFSELADSAPRGQGHEDTLTVPVIKEELKVQKRAIRSGVRIEKSVQEREEVIDEPFYREEVKVERVVVNRVVDGPMPVRQEGETLIIPLLEEVIVTEKRLVLREELHITKCRSEEHHQQRVTLLSEQADIEPIEDRSEDK